MEGAVKHSRAVWPVPGLVGSPGAGLNAAPEAAASGTGLSGATVPGLEAFPAV